MLEYSWISVYKANDTQQSFDETTINDNKETTRPYPRR